MARGLIDAKAGVAHVYLPGASEEALDRKQEPGETRIKQHS